MSSCRPLSVITATPPGFNPGMLASQTAACWFLRRHRLDREATFFRLIPMADRLGQLAPEAKAARLQQLDDGIEYQTLLHVDQLAATTPLYWGDLLHMRQYLDSIRGLLDASQDVPEDLLLLRRAPLDVVRRAVSFGTSFLYHSASDLTDEAYAPWFRRFVENARFLMPRDSVSSAQMAALSPRTPPVAGLDVTQLFCGDTDWRAAFPGGTDGSLARSDGLLCFFARGRHEIEDLNQAIRLFSTGFGLPVRWLPWGDSLSFPYVDRYAGRLDVVGVSAGSPPRLSALLEAVAAAPCVLTDTYHVAVIAWSLGTPAMIVGGDYWPHDYNAFVDKRSVFCEQHGLQDFFLPSARNHAELAGFIRRGVERVAEGKVLESHRMSVRRKVEACERQLAAALRESCDRA